MEEEAKWLIFSALWIFFGILWLIRGELSWGIGSIFVGLFYLAELMVYGPQKYASLKKRDKAKIAIVRSSVLVAAIILGYFAMGRIGGIVSFIIATIVSEIITWLIFFSK